MIYNGIFRNISFQCFMIRFGLLIGLACAAISLSLPVWADGEDRSEEAPARREWEKVLKKHEAKGPPVFFSYPPDGLRVSTQKVRFGGCTAPDATLELDGKAIRIFPNGAFAGLASLEMGKNELTFVATRKGKSTEVIMNVEVIEPPKPLPESPLKILQSTLYPDTDTELLPGDELVVRFKGSPGAEAWLSVEGLDEKWRMRELSVEKREASCPGYYQLRKKIRDDVKLDHADLRVSLEREIDGKKKSTSRKLDARLTTIPEKIKRPIVVLRDDAGLYTDQSTARRLTSVPRDTVLYTTGKMDRFRRVQLDEETSCFVYDSYVRDGTLKGQPPARKIVTSEVTREEGGESVLKIDFDWGDWYAPQRILPVAVETHPGTSTLHVTLYGIDRESGEVKWPEISGKNPLIASIADSAPTKRTMQLDIALSTERCWGFDTAFRKGAFYLTVRPAPTLKEEPDYPLSGLKVILDPGHGGTDTGAVGSSGLCESDINLLLSRRMEALLRAAGAEVLTTRDKDDYVSLEDRIAMISKSGANLMISFHNNSVPYYRNPFDYSGPLVFYYHGRDIPAAVQVYDNLTESMEFPRREKGVRYHYFRPMRRCTEMPTILLETLFMSNPEDEMKMLDPAFLDRINIGAYKGIVAFLESGDALEVPGDTESFLREVEKSGVLRFRADGTPVAPKPPLLSGTQANPLPEPQSMVKNARKLKERVNAGSL